MLRILRLLFALTIFSTSTFAQTMSLEELGQIIQTGEYPLAIPDNISQIVDINNLLDPYVGTWVGLDQGNTITFSITKSTKSYIRNIQLDYLNINYKIEQPNGMAIFDNQTLSNGSYSSFKGEYLNQFGNYQGRWYFVIDPQSICGSSGTFTIKRLIDINGDEYIVFAYNYGDFMNFNLCPNGFENPPIQRDQEIFLTKQ
jgi:hypothetical protein